MRGRLMLAAGAVVLLAGGLLLAERSDDSSDASAATGLGLETRTVTVERIEITVEPRRLDAGGAVFAITLETHSAELTMDLATATLVVDATAWPVAGWDGDGPGGHHREGTLRFDATGPSTSAAQLTLGGFAQPVELRWDLEG